MNVIFMDSRFVKPENWQYLTDVLKIKEIFSFNTSNELMVKLEQLRSNGVLISYQGNLSEDEFSKRVTYRIANLIKNSIPSFNELPEDLSERYPFCNTSKKFAPIRNIIKTQDINFLVLGSIEWVSYDKSIFIKHVSQYKDMAADIVFFALNILKKQLNTDIYRDRICSYMIDSISGEEFILTLHGWRKPKKKLLPVINTLLKRSYPQIFPSQHKEGKIKATPFYNIDLLETHRKRWREYLDELKKYEDMERQSLLDDIRAQEDEKEERRLIDDFWEELGENRWNID